MMDGRENYGAKSDDEPQDADAIFSKLKGWFRRDYDSTGQVKWRKEAHEDFDFDAGEQLSEDDKAILMDAKRPVVIFNRVGPVVDSVAGQEIGNRQEVQFIPRTQGDVKVNELMTSAAKWFRQECDAEDEESDAFRDMVVCGMGWTETRLDHEDNPNGDPRIDHLDPLSMVWDSSAKKRNLVDKRRVFHIRRDIPIDEARALCPGDADQPFEDCDYHASWVDIAKEGEGEKNHNDGRYYDKEGKSAGDEGENTVTMVRAQWIERVPAWLVLDPTDATGEKILTLDQAGYRDLSAKMKIAGVPMPKAVKTTRKVYRQAYLGNALLEIGDAPCKDQFSFQCMTAKRDRNKNTFYGLVRAMKDPARWANKWMSQTMHIMNTTAKGGIAAERGGFFDNDADGEASWAKQDQVTFLKPGALGGTPKWVAKPTSQFPQSSFQLMEFAVQSLPQVTGVNADILGMQTAASQAASLDMQRKQSALTILQPLFDSLRRYRKNQGRLMLYLIQNFLSDGRLIKIVGEEDAQYVPLIKQEGVAEYDVVVDEAKTSANQQEATWAYLQQILPVIGKMLPPATWLALLKYSPLPTSAQKDIADSVKASQGQPDPEQQKRDAELKLQQDKAAADIANTKAASDAKIQAMNAEAAASVQIAREKAQSDAALKFATAQQSAATEAAGNSDLAAMLAGFMQEMRQDMQKLSAAVAAKPADAAQMGVN